MKKYGKILLILLPFFYLILGFYFNQVINMFSVRNVDPEYVYLTNGLYMSLGHLNVHHIDNPGTPLQMLVAVVCRIVYAFRSHEIPYIEDVLMNSDLYLNMINHVVISITAVVLFLAGLIVTRLTNFLPYGLLVQATPFYSQITYDIIGRLTPELLIPIPVLLLTIMILKVVGSNEKKFSFRTLLFFSMISGFGLSIKLTFLPLLIIPVLVIPGYKDKGKFLLLSIISLFVFAIPILFDLVFFTTWMKDLFIHSGHYGGGEGNFIVWEQFFHNLRLFLISHRFLVINWVISLTLLFVYLVIKRKDLNKRLLYGLAGVLIVMLSQIIIVSKHYEYRYLIPGLCLFPVMIILSFEMLKRLIHFNKIKSVIGLLIVAGFIGGFQKQMHSIRIRSNHISNEMKSKMVTKHFVETLEEDAIKLITPSGYGCPFHDFSIMISHCWAGRANEIFLPVYKKLYPDTYHYFTWEMRKKYWEEYHTSKITDTDKPVYFYIANYSPELVNTSLSAMLPGQNLDDIKKELIFENTNTNEKIFKLKFR
ncbi:MAG: hypothetical protein KAT48_01700 [Bacteroidales bacterium]|nr:hypothetical protein [Bacteroidales bacterium]